MTSLLNLRILALSAVFSLAAAKVAGDQAVRRYEFVSIQQTVPLGRIAEIEGVRLHYTDTGSGPVLLLAHGLGATSRSFRLIIPELARHFRVIAPDLPGHGLSARDAPDLSLGAQARYLAGLLDHLGIERACLAGHSMGGSIVQRLALAFPGRSAGLALIASTTDDYMLRAAVASPILAPFVPLFVTLAVNNRFARQKKLQILVAHAAHITPEVRAEWSAPSRIRGHTRAYQQLMRDRAHDRRIDATALPKGTLIVWGDSDRLVSIDNGRRLAALIPGARLEVIEHAGHLVPEEQPEALTALLLDHFAGAPDAAVVAESRQS